MYSQPQLHSTYLSQLGQLHILKSIGVINFKVSFVISLSLYSHLLQKTPTKKKQVFFAHNMTYDVIIKRKEVYT